MASELNCASCKKRVLVHSMKYSKDGRGLICEECTLKQGSGAKLKIKTPTFSAPAVQTTNKIVYVCKVCSFKFSRGADFRGPKLCPNCGRDTIIYDLPNKADDLLRELERLDF
jgi:rubrerythrin